MKRQDLVKKIRSTFGEEYLTNDSRVVDWESLLSSIELTAEEIDMFKGNFDWSLFCKLQPMDSEKLSLYSEVIDQTKTWNEIFDYQILGESDFLKYYNKVGLYYATMNQHVTPAVLESIPEEDYNLSDLGRKYHYDHIAAEGSLLPEDFIIENIQYFSPETLLRSQIITPRILEVIKSENNLHPEFIEECLRDNCYNRSYIGRDWFLCYTTKPMGSKFNPLYVVFFPWYDPDCFYNPDLRYSRVYYKDQAGGYYCFSKVEEIREIGETATFVKRFPDFRPSREP